VLEQREEEEEKEENLKSFHKIDNVLPNSSTIHATQSLR